MNIGKKILAHIVIFSSLVPSVLFAQTVPSSPQVPQGSSFSSPNFSGNVQFGNTTPNVPATRSVSQTCPTDFRNFVEILAWVKCVIGVVLIPLAFSVALILFMWGVIRYVIAAGDTKQREEGKKFIVWGIIGLFVMVSIWGIVRLVTNTLGLGFSVPQLQTK